MKAASNLGDAATESTARTLTSDSFRSDQAGSSSPHRARREDLENVMVRIEDVRVSYRVYEDSAMSMKARVARGRLRRRHRTVKALRGVTLDLYSSETLGLIGPNGSGKSTLLAAMTGAVSLRSGTIRGRSRPALLGVSSVLRPPLSGRRNILIGGLALGLTRAEIKDLMDEIIDFSGLRESIDLPMRTYSQGMRARLHFAIATVKVPEILLIDEALAVGDEQFLQRSTQRLNQVRASAGAVVLVTHRMAQVKKLCDRVAWLDSGKLRAVGDPSEVVAAYLADQKR